MKPSQDQKVKRLPPLSLRLSSKERIKLEKLAGDMPLSAYIKSRIFLKSGGLTDNTKILSQILAYLGAKNINQNLGIIAKASEEGTLFVDDTVKEEIKQACSDIRSMHGILLVALGFKPKFKGVNHSFNGVANNNESSS